MSGSQSNFAIGLNYILIEVSLYQPHQVDCLRVFFFLLEHFYFSLTLEISQKVIQNICIVMLQFITPAVIFTKVKYDENECLIVDEYNTYQYVVPHFFNPLR
jgi:hypothetical protein